MKAEVFVDGLISNAESSEKIPSTANNSGYGSLKDQIWMPEDFNEPLEDFKDCM